MKYIAMEKRILHLHIDHEIEIKHIKMPALGLKKTFLHCKRCLEVISSIDSEKY